MSRQIGPASALIALTLVVVVFAFVLGAALVDRPETVIPLTLEAILLLGITVAIFRLEPDRETREWLRLLFAGAICLRLGALVLVHFATQPYFFAPDAWGYERLGQEIARYWRGTGPYPQALTGHWQIAYPYINGFFTFLLGESGRAAAVLNTFAGSWIAVVTFYLGREVMGVRVGRVAGVLAAGFPSLVLWSVLNIRDALATLLVVVAVWLAVRTYRKTRPAEVVLLAALLLLMSSLRDYMSLLLLTGMLLGWSLAVRPGRIGSTLVVGLAVAIFAALAAERLGLFSTVPLDSPIESMAGMREALQMDATSSYGSGYETTSLGQALSFLPVGVSYLMLAPFPWRIETSLQASAMPEVLLWYLLVPATLWGLWYAIVRGAPPTLVILGVTAVVIGCYALVEGNFGTAFRHRAQIMPVLFVFTAAGLVLIKHRWDHRRRKSRARLDRFARTPTGVARSLPR